MMPNNLPTNSTASYAKYFWARIGRKPDFPVDLERLAPCGFEVLFIPLINLSECQIESWMRDRGISPGYLAGKSALKGAILARGDIAIIFLNHFDSSAERRFTMAHELAHLILDYIVPRERAIARLGSEIKPVLDGFREPTYAEKLAGVLRGVPIGQFDHCWKVGSDLPEAVSEHRADLLAFELLAPLSMIKRYSCDAAILDRKLVHEFGFPSWAAEAYRRVILHKFREKDGFADWLKK